MEQPTNQIETFAIVEIMGHLKLAGMVKTEPFGAVMMLRVDVPELPEKRTKRTAHYDDDSGRYYSIPQLVEEIQPAEPAYTRYFGMQAVFSITPCDRATAMESLESLRTRPAKTLKIGGAGIEQPLLEATAEEAEEDDDEPGDLEDQLDQALNEEADAEETTRIRIKGIEIDFNQ